MFFLTPQERRIILFLAGVWCAGLCVRWLVLVHPDGRVYLEGEKLKIPLNTASYDELVESRLVPAGLARRIIDYRQAHGCFRTLDDLKNVRGIGEKRFLKLKDIFSLG